MNTTENNKLVAEYRKINDYTETECLIGEFMGYELIAINKPYVSVGSKNGVARFISDWNCLMEVVEKIERLKYSKELFRQQSIVIALPISTKIEIVYNACVEFIKWYNQQQLANS